MPEALQVGLVGCGRAAERLHLPAIRRCGALALRAVMDPVAARRRLQGRPYSLRLSHDRQLKSFAELARRAPSSRQAHFDAITVIRAMKAARVSAEAGGIEVPIDDKHR